MTDRQKKSRGKDVSGGVEMRGLGHTGGDGNKGVGKEGAPFSPSKSGTGGYTDSKTKKKDALLSDPSSVVRQSDRVKAKAMRDTESKKHRKRSS